MLYRNKEDKKDIIKCMRNFITPTKNVSILQEAIKYIQKWSRENE